MNVSLIRVSLFVFLLLGWDPMGALSAQAPITGDRFFLGSRSSSSVKTIIYEYDAAGALVATHDLASQLPGGIGTGLSRVTPCEVTNSGSLLCTTEYHPAGGWFMMDAQGVVGAYFPNAGQQTGTHDGAAKAVELPSGGVVGADYDGFNSGNIRAYMANGQPAWTSTAWEAWTPCVVGSEIYLGTFRVGPIRTWDFAGNALSSFGTYRHCNYLFSLPGQQLLIGHIPVDGQPHEWRVRDLLTGSESVLPWSYSLSGASVDALGNAWMLVGSSLLGFTPGASSPSITIPLSTGFADHTGLAVSGSPALGTPASYAPFGVGCAGPTGLTPDLAAPPGERPVIGTSSTLRVSNLPQGVTIPVFMLGFSNTQASSPAGLYPLPLELGILGWPGCYQLVSMDDTVYTITNTGTADHTVTLPPYPFLAGLQFHAQVLVLYAPTGVAVSNAVTATAGW